MQDDSFYYLQIAKNIAAGYGSTFDRINPTNGYHPLWTLVLVPLFWLVPHDNELAIHLTLTLQVLMTLAAMGLFYRFVTTYLDRTTAFFGLLLCLSPRLVRLWLDAMPTTLSVCLHLALINFVCLQSPLHKIVRARDDLVVGTILGLAFLSRLDAVFLIVAIVLTIAYHCLVRNQYPISYAIQRLVRIGLPVGLLSLPYLFHNLSAFGHLVPISGSLKIVHYDLVSIDFLHKAVVQLVWPFRIGVILLSSIVSLSILVPLLLALLCAVELIFLVRTGFLTHLHHLKVLSRAGFYLLFALLHYAYNSIFIPKSIIYSWYWVPEVIVGLFVVTWFFYIFRQWLTSQWETLAVVATSAGYALCVLLFIAGLALRYDHPRHRFLREIYQQAVWIKNSLPEDAIIAAWDAGALGYISERRVINLDGLVNNFELQEYKRAGRLTEYLDKKGCQYIAQFFFDNEDDMGKELESIRERLGERLFRTTVVLGTQKTHVPTVAGLGQVAYINVWRYRPPETQTGLHDKTIPQD